MDKKNYYFDQLIDENDMRDVEDRAEGADKRAVTDLMKGQMIAGSGLVATQNGTPNLNVLISAGIGYDSDGDRIYVSSQQTVDLSSHLPTNDEVWVNVSVAFARETSNPQMDGYGNTVQYDNDEGFEIVVTKGTEATTGNAVKPSIPTGNVSLFDVLLTDGMTQILNADINTARRHDNLISNHRHRATGIAYDNSISGLSAETAQAAIDELKTALGNQNDASEIAYDNGDSGLSASNVEDAIDEVQANVEQVQGNVEQVQSNLDDLAASVATVSTLPPIGSIIPFYDFNGALTFDPAKWAYCNGQSKTMSGIGAQTLPDLSNRYLVGFGADGGSDIGTAAWATTAVGIAGHAINLQHSHAVNSHTHSVPDHTHTTPNHTHTIASHNHSTPAHTHTVSSHSHSTPSHTHTVPSHSHDAGSLQFQTAERSGGGDLYLYLQNGSIHAPFSTVFRTANGGNTLFNASGGSVTLWTKNGQGSTGGSGTLTTNSGEGGSTTGGSGTLTTTSGEGGSTTGGSGTLTTNTGEGGSTTGGSGVLTSGSAAPGTDSQLSASQSIQPRSVRVRFIMRIA